jgi:hypothetical protein
MWKRLRWLRRLVNVVVVGLLASGENKRHVGRYHIDTGRSRLASAPSTDA